MNTRQMSVSDLDLSKLTYDDILRISKSPESEIIEWKEDIIKPADISDYVAQFSNNQGGLLIFGLNDDGSPSEKIKEFGKTNENMIQDGALSTTPSVPVEVVAFQPPNKASWIVVVKIPKPTDGITRISSRGALVKRVGSRRAMIQPHGFAYENQLLEGATFNDLDNMLLSSFYDKVKQKNPTITMEMRELLELFQIIRTKSDGQTTPTVAGMILFGKIPDVWVSGTRISVIRYTTGQRSNSIEDSVVLNGPILKTIQETTNKVWSLIRKSNYLLSGARQEIYEYPFIALREAIHNAFFHNDYQVQGNIFIEIFPDRLEVKNMGVPLGGTRLESLLNKPKHRNRILLKVLSEMGFVEGWGIGLRTMVDTLRSHGLPEPQLNVSSEETVLSFHTHTFLDKDTLNWIQDFTVKSPIEINFRQILALAYAKHQRRITNAMYQEINGVSTHVAGNELRELCSRGLLIQLGRGKSSHYALTELFDKDDTRLKKYFPSLVILRLSGPERKILSIIETFGKVSAKQIFYQSGYSDERGVKRILRNLLRLGLILRTGKSISDPSAYYEINKSFLYGKREKQLIETKPLQLPLDFQPD